LTRSSANSSPPGQQRLGHNLHRKIPAEIESKQAVTSSFTVHAGNEELVREYRKINSVLPLQAYYFVGPPKRNQAAKEARPMWVTFALGPVEHASLKRGWIFPII
jgi:hypothetical protein